MTHKIEKTKLTDLTDDELSNILLNLIIKKSKKWDIVDTTELIVKTETEYQLLQTYRSLKNHNSQQQNEHIIDKISSVDYNILQNSMSTRDLYFEKE
jgi:hypothetical protein